MIDCNLKNMIGLFPFLIPPLIPHDVLLGVPQLLQRGHTGLDFEQRRSAQKRDCFFVLGVPGCEAVLFDHFFRHPAGQAVPSLVRLGGERSKPKIESPGFINA